MVEIKTKEQLEAEWWQGWWLEDYTWEGLAKKPLQGWVVADGFLREAENGQIYGQPTPDAPAPVEGQSASLQDYWRADPETGRLRPDEKMGDELVSAIGKPLFHCMHLPLMYQDGTFTRKSGWNDGSLDSLIQKRLAASQETFFVWGGDVFWIRGADKRARLDGAIFWAAADSIKGDPSFGLSVSFDWAAFLERVQFRGARFCGYNFFRNAFFAGEADFVRAVFSQYTTFSGSVFCAEAHFSKATFASEVDFVDVIFLGSSNFRFTQFAYGVQFEAALFIGTAAFEKSRFRGTASFQDSQFSRPGYFDAVSDVMPDFLGAKLHPAGSFSRLRVIGLGKRSIKVQATLLIIMVVFYFSLFPIIESVLGRDFALLAGLLYFLIVVLVQSGLLDLDEREAMRAAALAKISAENRNHLDEARFFRHQLKAQRLQGPSSVQEVISRPFTWALVKPAEKGLGWTYEVVSDYGLSFIRPIIALIAVTLLSAFLYWAWERGGINALDPERQSALRVATNLAPKQLFSDADFLEAISFSASRAFPFGPWGEIRPPIDFEWDGSAVSSSQLDRCAFAARLLAVGHCRPDGIDLSDRTRLESHRLAVRLVGLGQSLATIVLAFLFGLAVRRRFQIS